MNNRLAELGNTNWADSSDDDLEAANGGGEVEMAAKQPKHMDHFFREVEEIKADIEGVEKATRSIGEINEAALQATTTEEENQLSNKLKPLISQTNKRAQRTKTVLGLLKEENEKLKKEGTAKGSDLRSVTVAFVIILWLVLIVWYQSCTSHPSNMVAPLFADSQNRVRENLCNTLTRKFIDEMKAYQASQQKYKTDIKKKVKRQVQIVNPDATDEDVDKVMQSEGGRDALYKQQILAGGVNDQVKTAYTKVASKYQDVLTLEQSVAELHQMFLDFALLTEQQGELLDQIEYQVREAGDYIEDANVDVYESIEYQKKIRKKQCWIILIVVIATIVLLFAIGVLP